MLHSVSDLAVLLTLAGVLAISHNILFFQTGLGLNVALFVLLMLLCIVFLLLRRDGYIGGVPSMLMAISLFFACMVFLRASEHLVFLNGMASLCVLLVLLYTQTKKQFADLLLGDYLKILLLPATIVPYTWRIFLELVTLRRFAAHGRYAEIIRGVSFAVIALGVFGSLFASADLVFGKYFYALFAFEWGDLPARGIWILIVGGFFSGIFSFFFTVARESNPTEGAEAGRLGLLEVTIVFSSVILLFLVFILLQFTYLFGGESHILTQGLTYAEYARKGFFELLAVTGLSFLLIATLERYVVRTEGAHTHRFQLLSSILILQVFLVLTSAFMRLSLYEHAYGFTIARLYAAVLMIWIGVALALLAHHIIVSGMQQRLVQRLFCVGVVFLGAVNILNPDAFVARQNIARYEEVGNIDISYVAGLSLDAIPYTIQLLEFPDAEIKAQFTKQLSHNLACHESCLRSDASDRDWRSLRVADLVAERVLASYADQLGTRE